MLNNQGDFMSKTFEEYLADIEKNGDTFPMPKSHQPAFKFKIIGENGLSIEFKKNIYLDYGVIIDNKLIAIEFSQKFYDDLIKKDFTLYLSEGTLYIDFNTDYYYILSSIDDNFFNQQLQNEQLTFSILKTNKTDIINKWTKKVIIL